jgi:hypothetical protein
MAVLHVLAALLVLVVPVAVLAWVVVSVMECLVGSRRDRHRELPGFDVIPPDRR